MTNQDNRPKDAADLRQKAEALARQRAARMPEDSAALSPEEIRKTLHELRVHQIELEMQNEELRTAQVEIEAGRARYFDLYDLAPVGYCTLSEKGLILEANLTAATLLETNRGELIEQPISRFILKEDQDIYYLHRKKLFETGEPQEYDLRLAKPDGTYFWAHLKGIIAQAEDGTPVCRCVLSDISERKQYESKLEKIAWMQDYEAGGAPESRVPYYGDVTTLNTERTIRDSVGLETLEAMGADLMRLLDTSVAVYEKNGDYAYGSFVSEWCSLMDGASRRLCLTDDNREALACGRWLCHENCWNESARAAIESGKPTDIACVGGIHLYGMPIFAGDEVVGAINIGYGDPPTDEATLADLAETFGVDVETLRRAASAFKRRPSFIVENAKARLRLVAKQIGQMVENRRKENEIHRVQALLHAAMDNSPAGIAIADAPSGKLRYVNDAGLLIRGGSREDIVNGVGVDQYVASWQLLDHDGSPMATDEVPLTRAIKYGEACSREFIIRRAEGDDRTVLARAAAIKDKYGKVEAAIVVFLDITERKQAEEELNREHEMLVRTEAAAHVGSWEWEAEGDKVTWSDELFRIFGLEPADEAQPFAEHQAFYVPEDRARLALAVEECVTTGTPYDLEVRVTRSDGALRHCVVRGFPWRDADGAVKRLYGSLQDITEIRHAEERATTMSHMLDDAPASITIHDTEGRFIFANAATVSLHGYESMEEFMEINLHDLDVPESEAAIAERMQRIAEEGEASFEVEHCRKDGSTFPLTVLAKRIEWEGRPAILSIAVDITEPKQAEETLIRQQRSIELSNRIANVFLTAAEDEVFADVLDSILVALDSRFGYFGYIDEAGDLVCPSMTREVWDQCQVPEKSIVFPRADWAGLWGRSLMEKLTLVANENLRIPEGHVALENALATPIVHHDKLIGQLVVADKAGGYDIDDRVLLESAAAQTAPILFAIQEEARQKTAHEKLEEQMRQAQKMEAVGRLAGGVAHDFNNMLGIILGHADMILEEMDPDQPFYADLTEIRKAGERSADLTRQLLAFARKQTVAPKVIDLNKTVEGMLKMLQRLIGEDIDMTWIPGKKVWPVKIDPAQIDQVLANLCVNARDAIADVGKVTIETGNSVFDEEYCKEHAGFVPGEYTLLTVSDNGCGMNAETLENIFEPFFTTKKSDKGTGLGLATVYGVVKQNNGFINVYSEPGQGTTFRIYLPRHRVKEASLPDKEAIRPAARGHETILLVEDEPAILRMTMMMLERTGYNVLAAGTPGEAIALAREHAGEIHLLMTDVVMPEMNGRDLAKNLLSLYPNLKRLFMSGYTANVIAHHGVLDEGVQFIQKPFAKQDLAIKVREVLDEAK